VSDATVDLVLFEVAGVRYGVDLAQVRRVDRDDPAESVGHPLGQPITGRRALVFRPTAEQERRLAIDTVLGVRRVPVAELRRLPKALAAPPLSVGAWVDGPDTVLLVDLHAMNPFTSNS
jgi:chemotaxis signal transduction protein